MNVHDACEQAYKNGYIDGRYSVVNHGAVQPIHIIGHEITPLKPNTELSFGAGDGNYDFLVNYRRAKPLNWFQIWMFKICFGVRARNL